MVIEPRALSGIKIGNRYRKDLGDIDSLMKSIESLGQLSPIGIDPDGNLLYGHRRYEAMRRLGRSAISVYVIDTLASAAKALKIERDENTQRKAMVASELAALGAALREIEKPAARERQGSTQFGHNESKTVPPRWAGPTQQGDTRDIVAAAVGLGKTTYGELEYVHKIANDETRPENEREAARAALAAMDADASIRREAAKVRALTEANKPRRPGPKPKPKDLDRISSELAGLPGALDAWIRQSNDLADFTAEQIGRWAADLRLARTAITQTIKYLERDVTA